MDDQMIVFFMGGSRAEHQPVVESHVHKRSWAFPVACMEAMALLALSGVLG